MPPAVVQSAKVNAHQAGGGYTFAVSLPSAVAVGSCVLVGVTSALFNTTDNSGGSVTDNQSGNTYTLLKHVKNNEVVATLFAALNVNASGTFTVTFHQPNTGETYDEMFVVELSGVATASAKDVDASATGFTFTPASGTTPTTTQANAIALALLGYDWAGGGGGTDPVPTTTASGWSTLIYEDRISSMHPGILSYRVLSATATQACTWNTTTTGYSPWESAAVIVVLKGAAASTQTVNPNPIATGEVVRLPTVTLGGTTTLLPNLIGTQEAVPGPTLKLQVLPGTIATAAAVPNPSIGATLPQHYYTTTFPLAEDPILEGGVWRSGRREGTYWRDYKTSGGNAYGKQDGGPSGGPPLFDDSIACLVGTFGSDQYARATVFKSGATGGWPEVELLLRWEITPNYARGYEVLFSTGRDYMSIMRWQGVPGTTLADFKNLSGDVIDAARLPVQHGDVVEARIVGNTISAWINGFLIATATDVGTYGAPWTGGTPGIGHNWWNDGTVDAAKAAQFGFQDFTAQTFVTVGPSPIASGAAVYAPTVAVGSSAQTVGPAPIASGELVPAPMAVRQVLPGTITTAAFVYTPAIVTTGATLVVQPDGIGTAAEVYAPLVRYPQTVTPNAIPSGELVYGPVVGIPVREVFPASIGSRALVYDPSVVFPPRPPAPRLAPAAASRAPALVPAGASGAPPLVRVL